MKKVDIITNQNQNNLFLRLRFFLKQSSLKSLYVDLHRLDRCPYRRETCRELNINFSAKKKKNEKKSSFQRVQNKMAAQG